MKISVVEGDIAKVPVDALITAVNPTGMWFGAIDGVIERYAGTQYHAQAQQTLIDRPSGTVCVATKQSSHSGEFDSVLFVVDALDTTLHDVVSVALKEASRAKMKSVSLPFIRFGSMINEGGTATQKAADLGRAIMEQAQDPENTIEHVVVVAYRNSALVARLEQALHT